MLQEPTPGGLVLSSASALAPLLFGARTSLGVGVSGKIGPSGESGESPGVRNSGPRRGSSLGLLLPAWTRALGLPGTCSALLTMQRHRACPLGKPPGYCGPGQAWSDVAVEAAHFALAFPGLLEPCPSLPCPGSSCQSKSEEMGLPARVRVGASAQGSLGAQHFPSQVPTEHTFVGLFP